MPDLDINGLPLASAVNAGDYFIKWDSTQVSGQRTQKLTAAQFRAYIINIIPVGPAGPPGTNGTNGQAAGFSSVSATTLPPGSQATATLGGTGPSNYTLTFGLPQGTPGTGNGNVNPTGTITDGAFALFSGTTGNLIKAGGTPAAIATSGSASDLTTGTLPAGRFPALTGDVTTAAGSLATTIAASAVTNAKLANAAASTIKGNATGSSTAPTDLTVAQAKTLLGYASSGANTDITSLASPALGAATATTATAGDNSTKVATTAFVLANGGGGAPTAVSTQSAAYTAVAGDKGKTLVLSGSATLTLGSGTATSGWYAWVKKSDGSGVWAITPASGTIDGLPTVNLYQESYLIWYDATNTVYRTQGRPKGVISISTASVSAVSNVTLTTGFGDTELRDLHVSAENCVPSASDILVLRVQKAGSTVTSGYSGSQQLFDGTNAVTGVAVSTAVYANPNNATSPQNAEIDLGNINNPSVTGGQPIVVMGNSPGSKQFISVFSTSTTSGATTGAVILFVGGSTLTGNVSLRGYRQ
jgi:hypothetical protein